MNVWPRNRIAPIIREITQICFLAEILMSLDLYRWIYAPPKYFFLMPLQLGVLLLEKLYILIPCALSIQRQQHVSLAAVDV